jgi:hypothetical protein
LKIISLGAGVQSSAMLLMALEGRFGDKPDCAIFADAQWEPKAVYEWLRRLEAEVSPFPIYRVTNGNIREKARYDTSGTRFIVIPTFVKNESGGTGMSPRQCTKEFKIIPIQRKVRQLVGPKGRAQSWIGISTDEAMRMKPSHLKWLVNRWPLIEANLSRYDCEQYLLKRMGDVAPKSSCIGCPFHGDDHWQRMKSQEPAEFADACEFDKQIRTFPNMRGEKFLHRSCRPLDQIEFLHEKQGRMFRDAFGNECEGLCGV